MAAKNSSAVGQEVKHDVTTPYDAAAVFGASVQLPSFDKVDPETWFTVADANFALRKVTDATTKYYYVLSKLDAATLRQLSAFLKLPKGEDTYQEIKDELCESYEAPLEEKIDAMFALTDMGDERLRRFGKELQRLGADASKDDMMKRIFVRCLPQRIVTAITASLGGSLETVIAAADKAWTASASPHGSSVSVSAVAGSLAKGAKRGGNQEQRPTGGRTTALNLCGFHKRFGDSARKCVPACSRWNEHRQRDTQARVSQVEEVLDGEDSLVGTAQENC